MRFACSGVSGQGREGGKGGSEPALKMLRESRMAASRIFDIVSLPPGSGTSAIAPHALS